MVNLEMTMGGYKVLVSNQRLMSTQFYHLGYIEKCDGKYYEFFTDPTVIDSFISVSSNDLREIANKVDQLNKRNKT